MGDNPPVITDEYKGEFNKIKENINTLVTINNQIIANAKKIANGDLTISLTKRCENDQLIESINTIVTVNNQIIANAKKIANGDLTISLTRRCENDQLIEALSVMIVKLNETITASYRDWETLLFAFRS